jgi:predicted nucleic acid-binding Zn ribbon protein
MNRRAPRPLSLALATLSARLEPASKLAAIQGCWETVVGEAIAQRAQPVAERSGVLEIACEDAVWAAELELMGPQLVVALNDAVGGAELRLVRVRADAARGAPRSPDFG